VIVRTETRRLQRLAEELEESGLPAGGSTAFRSMLLEEVDHALRPAVHERRVPSSGTILEPKSDPTSWTEGTELQISRTPLRQPTLAAARRFINGLSSWLLRRDNDAESEWVLFDRPAGSERDLSILADVMDATIVQRHPSNVVRVVGPFGVLRWEGLTWHHEPPVRAWIDSVSAGPYAGDRKVLEALLQMAVHDLGSLGIGALLVYRPDDSPGPPVEERLPVPPPLRVRKPAHLAPLRHALGQTDGAAVFDAQGVLRQLGVRLVPSPDAETEVDALGGTRHTSGVRYSHDDPTATVIVVSEDGPVSVLRAGVILRLGPPPAP
jgi:hypothetical protein